jgi:hypothetical protein
MIKKAVFEDELIRGMQHELQPHMKKQGMNNLVKAVEYLQAAAEIFEESGLNTKADQVFNVLSKIAQDNNDSMKKTRPVQKMPSLQKLFETGLSPKDVEKAYAGDSRSLAKVNVALRDAGYTEEETLAFLGERNFLPLETAQRWAQEDPIGTFQGWMTDVLNPSPKPGEQVEFKSLVEKPEEVKPEEELVFKSIAEELGLSDDNDAKGKPRKPKDPTHVSDRHTKGLTSEKMVSNMLGHGSWFNKADDHAADDNDVDIAQPDNFEEDYQKWLRMTGKDKPKLKAQDVDPDLEGLIQIDETEADDLLNVDLDAELMSDLKGVSSDKTFEDSD